MKILLLLAASALVPSFAHDVVSRLEAGLVDGGRDSSLVDAAFNEWRARHGKKYSSDVEMSYRRAIWNTSLEIVRRHNSKQDVSYKLGMNIFADMTEREFANKFLMSKGPAQGCSATGGWSHIGVDEDVPKSIDWREKGIVSKVKYQGHVS